MVLNFSQNSFFQKTRKYFSDPTTPGLIRPESDGKEGVLHIS